MILTPNETPAPLAPVFRPWAILGGLLVVFGLVALLLSSFDKIASKTTNRPATARTISPAEAEVIGKQAFDELSPAEHLKAAEVGLVDVFRKSISPSPATVDMAKRHLAAIPSAAAESVEARTLLRLTDARLRQIEKDEQARKVEAEIDAKPLLVVKSTWTKGGFGSVGLWTVTFKNRSKKAVGNIKYRTEYSSETGNVVSKGGVDSLLNPGIIQKVIPPGASRTIEVNDGFIHSEAHRASFEIVGWDFVPDRR
ncbi:MAG: hypothetical protein HY646_06440, partial [Acidobacteria bacterium]|nr:hypothetical protein [Acidobacteriota bacterium]